MTVSRACDGWKVILPSGRTVARFKGFRARSRAIRYANSNKNARKVNH